MRFLRNILKWFWDPNFWLPPNVAWTDVAQYSDHRYLYYPVPFALGLLIVRYFLEKYCYKPFGVYLGISPKRVFSVTYQPEFEALYKIIKTSSKKEITELARRSQITQRQIERWFRLRRAQDRSSLLKKFCETSFLFTYYTISFFYGLCVLWDKPWLWNLDECWNSYPNHYVSDGIRWYYMGSLTFYWSWLLSQFIDVRRKDFWEIFIHHIATIFLISFSWVCNVTRMGSLTMATHDCSEILIEAAKMAIYARYTKVGNTLLLLFLILWTITKLVIFPFLIIHSCTYGYTKMIASPPAHYVFNAGLLVIMGVNLFWTYRIVRLAYKSVLQGKITIDVSSSEGEIEEGHSTTTQLDQVKRE